MKFNCERCNTKYSISDDRVRGKILKIRCKNCSDVITVRDPAGRAESADGGALRKSERQSTVADNSENKRAPSSPGAAPESLVAEWYVSEDGEQEGPLNLDDAKEWVSAKDSGADLYCWSEGFDDWLPIDKVSHFRGLRIAAPTPAPVPPSIPAPAIPTPAPKPLFAATMAALGDESATVQDDTEASSDVFSSLLSGSSNSEAPAIPSVNRAKTAPPTPAPAATIPTPGAPVPVVRGLSGAPAIPALSGAPAALSNVGSGPALASEPLAPAPSEGPVFPPANPSDELDFEIGEASRIVDLPALMAQGRGMASNVTPSGKPLPGAAPHLPGMAAPPNGLTNGATVGNSLLPGVQTRSPSSGLPGAIGVGTGSEAAIGGVVPGMDAPPRERRKKAGLLLPLLLLGAGLIVVVVLFLVLGGEEETGGKRLTRGSVGGSNRLGLSNPDTRPAQEIPVTPKDVVGVIDAGPDNKNPKNVRPRNTNNNKRDNGENNGGNSTTSLPKNPRDSGEVDLTGSNKPSGPTGPLDGDDLMRTYRKNQIALKMCYERSLKRDPLLKVPKTWVDVKVSLAGKVTAVTIKSLRGTDLGQCLVGRIRRWKFRETTEVFNGRFLVVFDK